MKTRVRILNPAGGGIAWTSIKVARRYVKRGQARWTGDSLSFVGAMHEQICAAHNEEMKSRESWYQRPRTSAYHSAGGSAFQQKIRSGRVWALTGVRGS